MQAITLILVVLILINKLTNSLRVEFFINNVPNFLTGDAVRINVDRPLNLIQRQLEFTIFQIH
jgi:hypothetical protein